MLKLMVDGGTIGVNPSVHGGTIAYRLISSDNVTVIGEGSKVITNPLPFSNNMSEFLAAVYGMANTPAGIDDVTLFSDSAITLGRIFNNWKMTGIPKLWQERMNTEFSKLDNGTFRLTCELLDGHPSKAQLLTGIGKRGNKCSEHNLWCDKQCQLLSKQFLTELNTRNV